MDSKQNTKTHSRVRENLISAGLDLLQEGGTSALTLRKCAARAGVSHAAPAHHFSRIEGLLTAITARGFEIFAATMQAHLDRAPADKRERLYAICEGYLEFATKNEALYELMFTSAQLDFGDPDLDANSAASFEILQTCCAPYQDESTDQFTLEITIWSLLHGYCGLTKKVRKGANSHLATKVTFQKLFEAVIPQD